MSVFKADDIIYKLGEEPYHIPENNSQTNKILGSVKFTKWGKKCKKILNSLLIIVIVLRCLLFLTKYQQWKVNMLQKY